MKNKLTVEDLDNAASNLFSLILRHKYKLLVVDSPTYRWSMAALSVINEIQHKLHIQKKQMSQEELEEEIDAMVVGTGKVCKYLRSNYPESELNLEEFLNSK